MFNKQLAQVEIAVNTSRAACEIIAVIADLSTDWNDTPTGVAQLILHPATVSPTQVGRLSLSYVFAIPPEPTALGVAHSSNPWTCHPRLTQFGVESFGDHSVQAVLGLAFIQKRQEQRITTARMADRKRTSSSYSTKAQLSDIA